MIGRIHLPEIRAKQSPQAHSTRDKWSPAFRQVSWSEVRDRCWAMHPSVSSSKLHLRINKEGCEACVCWMASNVACLWCWQCLTTTQRGLAFVFEGNIQDSEDKRSHLWSALFKADKIKSTSWCLIYRCALVVSTLTLHPKWNVHGQSPREEK